MDTAPRPFWHRIPYGVAVTVRTSTIWAACVFLLVASLSTAAEWSANPATTGTQAPVALHALAMTAVAALCVGVATALARQRHPELAALVVVATAVGPMTLVAVPLLPALVAPNDSDTVLTWHAGIAVMLVGLLGIWTRQLVEVLELEPPAPPTLLNRVVPGAVFAFAVLASDVAYWLIPEQSNVPVFRAVLGWGVLAAGIVVCVGWSRSRGAALLALLGSAFVLLTVTAAYTRVGGWPAVAGWERDGMQSPIITSWASTVTLLAAPVVGLAVLVVRRRLMGEASAPIEPVEPVALES